MMERSAIWKKHKLRTWSTFVHFFLRKTPLAAFASVLAAAEGLRLGPSKEERSRRT
jgi:hypothetical protein